jgi:hypothetical protein
MRRRINSTGRIKIPREKVAIQSGEDDRFHLTLEVASMGLPGEAIIVVEAHRQSVTERFPFGTVANPGASSPTKLGQLALEDVQFRVKIIEPVTGRLLARAERLKIDGGDGAGRRELLPVRVKHLGPQPWKAVLEHGNEPVLLLNDLIPGAGSRIINDPAFQALILPAAFREVLTLLWAAKETPEPDDDTPPSRWLGFAENLAGSDVPDWEDLEAAGDWIDAACDAFASRHNFMAVLKEGPDGDRQTAH